jgi:hypothetical protein
MSRGLVRSRAGNVTVSLRELTETVAEALEALGLSNGQDSVRMMVDLELTFGSGLEMVDRLATRPPGIPAATPRVVSRTGAATLATAGGDSALLAAPGALDLAELGARRSGVGVAVALDVSMRHLAPGLLEHIARRGLAGIVCPVAGGAAWAFREGAEVRVGRSDTNASWNGTFAELASPDAPGPEFDRPLRELGERLIAAARSEASVSFARRREWVKRLPAAGTGAVMVACTLAAGSPGRERPERGYWWLGGRGEPCATSEETGALLRGWKCSEPVWERVRAVAGRRLVPESEESLDDAGAYSAPLQPEGVPQS